MYSTAYSDTGTILFEYIDLGTLYMYRVSSIPYNVAHNAIPDQNVPYFEFVEKRLENGYPRGAGA